MTDIFSFSHASFGKTTNAAGAAGDNAKYNGDLNKTQMKEFLEANAKYLEEHGTHRPQWQIDAHLYQIREGRSAAENAAYNARQEASYAVRSFIIPADPDKAKEWFDAQEKADRINARMSDRIIFALSRKFSPQQCIEVVEDFCRTVTKDQVPWHAALHLELDKRDDPDWNPHAHIIFRDRHIETGNRFLFTTAGAKERRKLDAEGITWWDTNKFRAAFADAVNRGFERYGIEGHVDHRSYKVQGIDKVPGIHLGPKANALKRKGITPQSKDFARANRQILYTAIDNGTRADHNEKLKKDSLRPKKPIHPELTRLSEKQYAERKAMWAEQKRDRAALRLAHNKQIADHKKWAKTLYAEMRKAALKETKEKMDPRWKAARSISKLKERNDALEMLKLHQKVLYANTNAKHVVAAKKTKDTAYKDMMKRQVKERDELAGEHRDEYKSLSRQHLAERIGMTEQLHRLHVTARMRPSGLLHQQTAAMNLLRSHTKTLTPVSSAELSRQLYRVAHIEADKLKAIRLKLNAQRQSRLFISMPNERRRSQANDAIQPVQRVQQALQTGLTLTDADKLNASPEQRQQLANRERKDTKEAVFTYVAQKTTGKGRDRGGGGGRGR